MLNIINKYLTQFGPYIILGMAILIVILFIMLIVLFKCLDKLETRFRRFTRGVDNKNLEEVIDTYFEKVDLSKEKVDNLELSVNKLNEELKMCIQKTAIKRYKAFDDIGSDLSFSIALLDEYNNGIILTSIYTRDDSVVYAKPIDRGISRYDLSGEEEEVLNIAVQKAKKVENKKVDKSEKTK